MMYGTTELTPDSFQSWQLDETIDEMLSTHLEKGEGKTSRTLLKGKELTVVLTVLPKGHELHEHKAPASMMVVPLRGEAVFSFGNEVVTVSNSDKQVLAMGKSKAHSVKGVTDSAFLLIMGALKRGSPS